MSSTAAEASAAATPPSLPSLPSSATARLYVEQTDKMSIYLAYGCSMCENAMYPLVCVCVYACMYYANPTENESGVFHRTFDCWMVFLLSVVATLELLSSAVCTFVHMYECGECV